MPGPPGVLALARDDIPARYPDAYAEGTPDSHYTAAEVATHGVWVHGGRADLVPDPGAGSPSA